MRLQNDFILFYFIFGPELWIILSVPICFLFFLMSGFNMDFKWTPMKIDKNNHNKVRLLKMINCGRLSFLLSANIASLAYAGHSLIELPKNQL